MGWLSAKSEPTPSELHTETHKELQQQQQQLQQLLTSSAIKKKKDSVLPLIAF